MKEALRGLALLATYYLITGVAGLYSTARLAPLVDQYIRDGYCATGGCHRALNLTLGRRGVGRGSLADRRRRSLRALHREAVGVVRSQRFHSRRSSRCRGYAPQQRRALTGRRRHRRRS